MSDPDPRRVGVGLPFFIQYDGHRSEVSIEDRRALAQRIGTELTEGSLDWVEIGTDPEVLAAWVGRALPADIRVSRRRGSAASWPSGRWSRCGPVDDAA